MSYTITQKQYVALKSKLTRAINSKDLQKIIATAKAALDFFEEAGYPDDWHRWKNAQEDAEWKLSRQNLDWLRT